MKILIILLLSLTLSACATLETQDLVEGEFYASIYMTHGAYTGEVKEKTGFEFYIEHPEYAVGPILNGYRFENGILIDSFSKGSESAETVNKLKKINLRPFDYSMEIKAAEKKWEGDNPGYGFITTHIAKWHIKIITDSGVLEFNAPNPGGDLKHFAKYSEDLTNLELFFNTLAMYYGSYYIIP